MGNEFDYRDAIGFSKTERKHGRTGNFQIYNGEVEVGRVSFRYNYLTNKYYFYNLKIYPEFRSGGETYKEGEGFGANLIEGVNDFLKHKKAIGFLENGITEDEKRGLYSSHGWVYDKKEGKYYFDGTKDL